MNPNHSICLSLGALPPDLEVWLQRASLVEIRFDLIGEQASQILPARYPNTEFIATFRKAGQNPGSQECVLRKAMLDGYHWIDLDIQDDMELLNQLKPELQKAKTKCILSYHNFQETPDLDQLLKIKQTMNQHQPDLKKIVCFIQNHKDVWKLKSLYPDKNLISFGMGERGRQSRLDCLQWGAPFSYAYPDSTQATAPGQISFSQLTQMLNDGFSN